jgi:hypothetical protein
MTPAAATTTSRAAAAEAAADSGPDRLRPVPDEIAVKVLEVEVLVKVADLSSIVNWLNGPSTKFSVSALCSGSRDDLEGSLRIRTNDEVGAGGT